MRILNENLEFCKFSSPTDRVRVPLRAPLETLYLLTKILYIRHVYCQFDGVCVVHGVIWNISQRNIRGIGA